ncbi:MAG: hypothetical protein M0Z32_06840 [Actinomycetota bacterium]|nr:hypothetical protein [Actinomycetota bacterium]MCL6093114.1 hypothetical protein [Actinomycetota bacterium]MDA8167443.1 hypothetical protein [Actinomycetota bacterium]
MKKIFASHKQNGWNVNPNLSKLDVDISREVSAEVIGIRREAAASVLTAGWGGDRNDPVFVAVLSHLEPAAAADDR